MNSAAAETIARYCQAREGDMRATLERIVNIDSCSPDPAGVTAVGEVLARGLAEVGFATERVPPPSVAVEPWVVTFFMPEDGGLGRIADHLVGRRAATNGGRGHALLTGHTDTAFPPGEPARNPFRIDGERAYGCAVADMKGGLVVILYAVRALAECGLAAPRLTVLYDSDEQAGSLTARPLIERIARDEGVDWAFTAEMGLAGGALRCRRPALGVALLEIEGIETHVGTGYWSGASAIEALARLTSRLHALSDRERALVVNVGEVGGGKRRNLVAGHAWAKLDIRARTQPEWEALAEAVRAVVAGEVLPGTRGRGHIYNHRPAMEPTAQTDALMATVARAAAELGQSARYVEASGGSDANFTAALGIPTLDGFGPAGGNTMTRDECIELRTLPERAALLALTLHKLAG
jgi:glutamate carboxypeptidase